MLLAQIYQQEKNLQVATVYYKRYLDHRPDDQDAAYNFGLSLLKEGRFEELHEIASRMTDIRALPLLAQVRIQRQDHEGAMAAFQRYIASLESEEEMLYEDIEPGLHTFRVRARDGSGCWGISWQIITFYVE